MKLGTRTKYILYAINLGIAAGIIATVFPYSFLAAWILWGADGNPQTVAEHIIHFITLTIPFIVGLLYFTGTRAVIRRFED